MLNAIKLLIPALLPSWRFFDFIAPSPRIQFTLLNSDNEPVQEWQEFRPRPAQLSFLKMLGRMLWNPVWNESLFMVSCAERLIEAPTQHSEDEILKRIRAELAKNAVVKGGSYIQFRLMQIRRDADQLVHDVVFQSRTESLSKSDAA